LNDNQLWYAWCVHEKRDLQRLDDTCIVSIKWGWLCLRKSKFSQKTTKPNYYWASSKHGTILRFSRWFRDSRLFLTFPWDQWRAKKHAPTSDRVSSIRASCPIGITISTQLRRISNRKEWDTMRASLQVTNYTANCCQVKMARRMHELTYLLNIKRNVRVCYTLILDLKILAQSFFLTFQVIWCVSDQLHLSLHLISILFANSMEKGILVISCLQLILIFENCLILFNWFV
jgi:hypothetical protein